MYHYQNSTPRWINFENRGGRQGGGGAENGGAKGHAWEHLYAGEEKVLCDFSGTGVLRRMWFTLSDRDLDTLQKINLVITFDHAAEPQVKLPFSDFFGFGAGAVKPLQNKLFTTAEGRSFTCLIPMPFRSHLKVVLKNNGDYVNNLFYDLDVTLEALGDDALIFRTEFKDYTNLLTEDVELLSYRAGRGRYLGTSFTVFPNAAYAPLWWGEGEVKVYLDGDRDTPTLCGTGAEDYLGSAWELGEFTNDESGCVFRSDTALSMYRYHITDPIFFSRGIRVTLQAMGGGNAELVKKVPASGAPCLPVSYDDGDFHGIFGTDTPVNQLKGYVNFYRQDRYRITTYFYLDK